ncbi:MAG: hypothetical protein NZ762_03500, partial [Dehalococcoidia bacterium]|nr:hypothetical protein [Dehalococcoidia bacterium]
EVPVVTGGRFAISAASLGSGLRRNDGSNLMTWRTIPQIGSSRISGYPILSKQSSVVIILGGLAGKRLCPSHRS